MLLRSLLNNMYMQIKEYKYIRDWIFCPKKKEEVEKYLPL